MLRGLKEFNLPQIEEQVLKFWRRDKTFKKSLDKGKKAKKFIFYEGPPTANGRPGTHHVLARAFKDVVLRYKTMRGFVVERRAGWDTQGLPVEIEVEKELGFKTKQDIEKFGVANFNERCRQSVWKYKEEWERLTERIGFWLDFDNAYVTYKNEYLEALWGIFKEIDKRKLLKKFYKVVPYCARCQTTLSSHELGQPGAYRKVKDPSIYIKLKLKGKKNEYLLVWTTTPWTLPANLGVAVNPKLIYKKFQVGKEVIWSANNLPLIDGLEVREIGKAKGSSLVGKSYEPLYKNKGKHKVYGAGFVEAEEGTGLVHLAPFGEDDLELMKKEVKQEDLPITVDEQGRVVKGLPGAGKFIKEADYDILTDLSKRGLLYYKTKIEHEYPFCWRCASPLVYYPRVSWFIEMSKLRKDLENANKNINWVPKYVKEGRFGNWLADVKDWAISRERYWGTPLPIWECDKCDKYLVVGSLDELGKLSGGKLPRDKKDRLDLHRPYVDEIRFDCPKCRKKGKMSRVKEIADVWFDSGSMPFASGEYPDRFPADYICEAMDQTRGWFYTLLAVSVLMKQKEPYKNVISLGLIVDKNGQKMSKSKGNVVDPWQLIQKYGVDAVRWYFYSVNHPEDVKKFAHEDVGKALRRVILIIYNSYKFYDTYCDPKKIQKTKHILDKWIVSRYHQMTDIVGGHLDKLRINEATQELEVFVDDLSRWYIRRSRKRGDEIGETLGFILEGLAKVLAPFTPFFAEALYQSFKNESVHLTDFPKPDKKLIDKELLSKMVEVRELASLALAKRAEAKIKVRQPLALLKVQSSKSKIMSDKDLLDVLADEINVKKVVEDKKIKEIVELDIKITPTLKLEGQVRELVRMVQDMRQKMGLQPKNEIKLVMDLPEDLKKALSGSAGKSFKKDVNAVELDFKKPERYHQELSTDLDGQKIWLGIRK